MRAHLLLPLVALPLLAGCMHDAASYQIAGRDHALTLIADQPWFWKPEADLAVVAARLPDCQRRHNLKAVPIASIAPASWMAMRSQYSASSMKWVVTTMVTPPQCWNCSTSRVSIATSVTVASARWNRRASASASARW